MIDVPGVQPGMDVYGSDGEKLGTVASVERTLIGGSGLDTGGVIDVDAGSTPNTYVKVAGDRTLWVPVQQIAGVADGRVTLTCESVACIEHYSMQPPGLG